MRIKNGTKQQIYINNADVAESDSVAPGDEFPEGDWIITGFESRVEVSE